MKMESGGVATSSSATTVLHKIKVKEESKECCPALIQQNSSSATSVTVTSSSSPPPRIGAIATITISNCGSELAAVAKRTVNSINSDAFPVDLDIKSRAKAQARDKVPAREDANGTESHGSSSPSPSSSPSSHYATQPSKTQATRANSSSSARSPESDDQSASLQPLKTESLMSEEATLATNHRSDETKSESNGIGGRCISAIFATHSKLRRLLGTLVQFATDISPDTGDTVRALVLSLLSGSMSAEEFHSALQEATNFPLRGFVLPYLKHNLPALQRDLSAAARTDSQTCAQYLRANEPAVLEAVGLSESAVELFAPASAATSSTASLTSSLHQHHHHHYAMRPPVTSATVSTAPAAHIGFATHAVKRRASDALFYENGVGFDEGPPYSKRSTNPWVHSHHHGQQQQQHHLTHLSHQQQQQSSHPDAVPYCWYTQPLHSSALAAAAAAAAGHHPLIPSLVQTGGGGGGGGGGYASLTQSQSHLTPHQPAISHGSAPASGASSSSSHNGSDDEWKNIHVMLNCILGMVEKTKRALAILQKRGCTSPAAPTTVAANTSSLQAPTNGAQSNGSQQLENAASADRDGTFKRLSGEIVAQTIRATEDRVAEVKRRAEEAVQEVKRAAMAEVQRAVAAAMAESRATERLRNHRYHDNLAVSQQQQRTQQPIRPNAFLRLQAETASSSTVRTTTGATPTAANATSSSNDDGDKESHLTSTIGSNCWNCGRPALETCGGCGIARYCGSFCQHRDWEAGGHHATCRSTTTSSTASCTEPRQERDRSTTPSPPRTGSAASDSDVTKTATSSTSSASSVRSVK